MMPIDAMYLAQAIDQYTADCERAFRILQEHLGTDSPFRAWVHGMVARQGSFRTCTSADASYLFHGGECYVNLGDRMVDIQFDERGLPGQFDAWRILAYLADNRSINVELEDIAATLDWLHGEGLIDRVSASDRRYRKRSAACN